MYENCLIVIYLKRSRVKSEHSKYAKEKKMRATSGGHPPIPPKYDKLMEAVTSLIKDELEYAEQHYDSTCRDVTEPKTIILEETLLGKYPIL